MSRCRYLLLGCLLLCSSGPASAVTLGYADHPFAPYQTGYGREPADPPGMAVELVLESAQRLELPVVLERADLSQRYIPRRPHLLPQLIQSVNDSTASARSIGRIIGSDPLLTVNLLRIANSPFYRIQERPVESLMRAATLLGLDGLRPVIAAALVQPVMNPPDGDGGRFSQRVWDYTLRMSLAAADHARSVEREDGFSAQLAGLLRGLAMVMVVRATAATEASASPRKPRLMMASRSSSEAILLVA